VSRSCTIEIAKLMQMPISAHMTAEGKVTSKALRGPSPSSATATTRKFDPSARLESVLAPEVFTESSDPRKRSRFVNSEVRSPRRGSVRVESVWTLAIRSCKAARPVPPDPKLPCIDWKSACVTSPFR